MRPRGSKGLGEALVRHFLTTGGRSDRVATFSRQPTRGPHDGAAAPSVTRVGARSFMSLRHIFNHPRDCAR